MSDKIRSESLDTLFEAILSLDNKEECYSFFVDLCTVTELHALAQRLEVAMQLRGKSTYMDISTKTGASTATISRVNRALNYGQEGYNTVIDRLEKQEGK